MCLLPHTLIVVAMAIALGAALLQHRQRDMQAKGELPSHLRVGQPDRRVVRDRKQPRRGLIHAGLEPHHILRCRRRLPAVLPDLIVLRDEAQLCMQLPLARATQLILHPASCRN
ncbi:MAG: hypothetical protein ABGY24_04945, partial [bacterium]